MCVCVVSAVVELSPNCRQSQWPSRDEIIIFLSQQGRSRNQTKFGGKLIFLKPSASRSCLSTHAHSPESSCTMSSAATSTASVIALSRFHTEQATASSFRTIICMHDVRSPCAGPNWSCEHRIHHCRRRLTSFPCTKACHGSHDGV